MADDTLNDRAWRQLFDELSICDHIDRDGEFLIQSKQIKKVREPRLMAKFDHESQLPSVFKENDIGILPVSRSAYLLSKINTFQRVVDFPVEDIHIVPIPKDIETIDFHNISSEPTAIYAALHAGILSRFSGEKDLRQTVSGRMGSGSFRFGINIKGDNSKKVDVDVKSAQVEIDAGFETAESLILIEAKNSLASDFNIRQLYYPYRLWKKSTGKRVRNLFLTHTNGVYDVTEYEFGNEEEFHSIYPVKRMQFKWDTGTDARELDFDSLFVSIEGNLEDAPFPQADSFEKVIDIFEQIAQSGQLTKEQITYRLDYDPRQSDYYANACVYLGWVLREPGRSGSFIVSDLGCRLYDLPLHMRNEAYARSVLSNPIFHDVCRLKIENGELSTADIVSVMKKHPIGKELKDSTYRRRARTVDAWTDWVIAKRPY